MKPFVRTSFLGTRPSCLPSPGRPLFDTDDDRQPSNNDAAYIEDVHVEAKNF